jgi:hypothetical protein
MELKEGEIPENENNEKDMELEEVEIPENENNEKDMELEEVEIPEIEKNEEEMGNINNEKSSNISLNSSSSSLVSLEIETDFNQVHLGEASSMVQINSPNKKEIDINKVLNNCAWSDVTTMLKSLTDSKMWKPFSPLNTPLRHALDDFHQKNNKIKVQLLKGKQPAPSTLITENSVLFNALKEDRSLFVEFSNILKKSMSKQMKSKNNGADSENRKRTRPTGKEKPVFSDENESVDDDNTPIAKTPRIDSMLSYFSPITRVLSLKEETISSIKPFAGTDESPVIDLTDDINLCQNGVPQKELEYCRNLIEFDDLSQNCFSLSQNLWVQTSFSQLSTKLNVELPSQLDFGLLSLDSVLYFIRAATESYQLTSFANLNDVLGDPGLIDDLDIPSALPFDFFRESEKLDQFLDKHILLFELLSCLDFISTSFDDFVSGSKEENKHAQEKIKDFKPDFTFSKNLNCLYLKTTFNEFLNEKVDDDKNGFDNNKDDSEIFLFFNDVTKLGTDLEKVNKIGKYVMMICNRSSGNIQTTYLLLQEKTKKEIKKKESALQQQLQQTDSLIQIKLKLIEIQQQEVLEDVRNILIIKSEIAPERIMEEFKRIFPVLKEKEFIFTPEKEEDPMSTEMIENPVSVYVVTINVDVLISYPTPLNNDSIKHLSQRLPVHPSQLIIANALHRKSQEILKSNQNQNGFQAFDFYIFIPRYNSLKQQTIDRLKQFKSLIGDMSESEIASHVVLYSYQGAWFTEKIKEIYSKIMKNENTLFVLIVDECHFAPTLPTIPLLHDGEYGIGDRKNVIKLLVSATPFNVLSEHSKVLIKDITDDDVPETMRHKSRVVDWKTELNNVVKQPLSSSLSSSSSSNSSISDSETRARLKDTYIGFEYYARSIGFSCEKGDIDIYPIGNENGATKATIPIHSNKEYASFNALCDDINRLIEKTRPDIRNSISFHFCEKSHKKNYANDAMRDKCYVSLGKQQKSKKMKKSFCVSLTPLLTKLGFTNGDLIKSIHGQQLIAKDYPTIDEHNPVSLQLIRSDSSFTEMKKRMEENFPFLKNQSKTINSPSISECIKKIDFKYGIGLKYVLRSAYKGDPESYAVSDDCKLARFRNGFIIVLDYIFAIVFHAILRDYVESFKDLSITSGYLSLTQRRTILNKVSTQMVNTYLHFLNLSCCFEEDKELFDLTQLLNFYLNIIVDSVNDEKEDFQSDRAFLNESSCSSSSGPLNLTIEQGASLKYFLKEKIIGFIESHDTSNTNTWYTESDRIVEKLLYAEHDPIVLIRCYDNDENHSMRKILRHCLEVCKFAKKNDYRPFSVIGDTSDTKLLDEIEPYYHHQSINHFEFGTCEIGNIPKIRAQQLLAVDSKKKSSLKISKDLKYEDLKGLRCLLILCEKGRMGDTFPHTLSTLDLRLRTCRTGSGFIQELGRMCRYPNVTDEKKSVKGSVLLMKLVKERTFDRNDGDSDITSLDDEMMVDVAPVPVSKVGCLAFRKIVDQKGRVEAKKQNLERKTRPEDTMNIDESMWSFQKVYPNGCFVFTVHGATNQESCQGLIRSNYECQQLIRNCHLENENIILKSLTEPLPYALISEEYLIDIQKAIDERERTMEKENPPNLEEWRDLHPIFDFLQCSKGLDDYLSKSFKSPKDIGKFKLAASPEGKNKVHYDTENKLKEVDLHRMLLKAECQIGKTGAFLAFLKLLNDEINAFPSPLATTVVAITEPERYRYGYQWFYPFWKDLSNQRSIDYGYPKIGKYHSAILLQRASLVLDFLTRQDKTATIDALFSALEKDECIVYENALKCLEKQHNEFENDGIERLLDWDGRMKQKTSDFSNIVDVLKAFYKKDNSSLRNGIVIPKYNSKRCFSFWDSPLVEDEDNDTDPDSDTNDNDEEIGCILSEEIKYSVIANDKTDVSAKSILQSVNIDEQPLVEVLVTSTEDTDLTEVKLSIPLAAFTFEQAPVNRRFPSFGKLKEILKEPAVLKYWIFTPSYFGTSSPLMEKLLFRQDCFQPIDGNSLELWRDYFQVLIVRASQFHVYKKYFGNQYIIIQLPEIMSFPFSIPRSESTSCSSSSTSPSCYNVEEGGIGFSRAFIQRIATQLNLSAVWMLDDNIKLCYKLNQIQNGAQLLSDIDLKSLQYDPTPFSEVMYNVEDILLCSEPDWNEQSNLADRMETRALIVQSHGIMKKYQSNLRIRPDRRSNPSCTTTSKLVSETTSSEFVPEMKDYVGENSNYGIIGIGRVLNCRQQIKDPIKVTYSVYSFFLFNVSAANSRSLCYLPKPIWEDIEMIHAMEHSGLVVCKLQVYSHYKPPHGLRKIRAPKVIAKSLFSSLSKYFTSSLFHLSYSLENIPESQEDEIVVSERNARMDLLRVAENDIKQFYSNTLSPQKKNENVNTFVVLFNRKEIFSELHHFVADQIYERNIDRRSPRPQFLFFIIPSTIVVEELSDVYYNMYNVEKIYPKFHPDYGVVILSRMNRKEA